MSKVGVQRATTRATNKSLLKTRTQARKSLAKRFNLPAKVINPTITHRGATRTRDRAIIQGRGSRIPIYKTKGSKTQKRLGVSVNTGTGRRVIKHSFIATMPSGHTGIFKRTNNVADKRVRYVDSQGRRNTRALHIRELTFPSPAHMIVNRRVADPLFKFYTDDFPTQLKRQLNAEMDKARPIR